MKVRIDGATLRLVYNSVIPFKGFAAINICGLIFVRNGSAIGTSTLRHECIHTAQMRELGYIGFYVLYLLEWLCRLVFHTQTAYRGISFEREAYTYERDLCYLHKRKHYAQWRRR